jgi:hypothetical protein
MNLLIDIPVFRVQFKQFEDVLLFPDLTIQMYFDMATNYISNSDYGRLNGSSRLLALYLMTAHLLYITDSINQGKPAQMTISASEGTVSVGFQPPPITNGWQWWLSATPYGQQLWALLSSLSVGGFYVGRANSREGFRHTDGYFKGVLPP